MVPLAIMAAAMLAGGPGGADPRRVAEQVLGRNGEGRVSVVFPDAAGDKPHNRAVFYLWANDRWCRIGTGDYVRGSNRIDRGGRNPSIRLIDRRERAVDMYWADGRPVLMRRGKQIAALDVPAQGCK